MGIPGTRTVSAVDGSYFQFPPTSLQETILNQFPGDSYLIALNEESSELKRVISGNRDDSDHTNITGRPPPSDPPSPPNKADSSWLLWLGVGAGGATLVGSVILLIRKIVGGRKAQNAPNAPKENLRQTMPIPHPIVQPIDYYRTPDRQVVIGQLEGLAKRGNPWTWFMRWIHRQSCLKEGKLFLSLDKKYKLYLASLAINRWLNLSETQKMAFRDPTDSTNVIPIRFIIWFAKKYLQEENITKINIADFQLLIVQETKPNQELVANQFAADLARRDMEYGEDVLQYMAKFAIDEWNRLDIVQQANFVNTEDLPDIGEMPYGFIMKIKEVYAPARWQTLLVVYNQILEYKPEFAVYGFSITNSRVKQLLLAWGGLPNSIQKVFVRSRTSGRLPPTFMDLMKPFLRVGTTSRKRLDRQAVGWRFTAETQEITREGYNLSSIMEVLARENDELRYYPKYLRERTLSLTNDWKYLKDYLAEVAGAFEEQDMQKGLSHLTGELGLSIIFARFWARIDARIGASEREAMPDGPTPSGGGEQTTPRREAARRRGIPHDRGRVVRRPGRIPIGRMAFRAAMRRTSLVRY